LRAAGTLHATRRADNPSEHARDAADAPPAPRTQLYYASVEQKRNEILDRKDKAGEARRLAQRPLTTLSWRTGCVGVARS
jgi:hypothetical protein